MKPSTLRILSVGQIIQHGYFLFGDDMVAIFEDRQLEHHVVTVQMTRNICFPLLMKDMNIVATKAVVEENIWDWDRRMRHLNFQSS